MTPGLLECRGGARRKDNTRWVLEIVPDLSLDSSVMRTTRQINAGRMLLSEAASKVVIHIPGVPTVLVK